MPKVKIKFTKSKFLFFFSCIKGELVIEANSVKEITEISEKIPELKVS